MPRLSVVSIGVLNIKIHPHTPDLYHQLFQTASSKRYQGKIRGNDFAVFGWMQPMHSSEPLKGLHGEVFRFMHIDPSQPWLDMVSFKPRPITKEQPLPVPENLQPNLRQVPFVFYPSQHRFAFDTKRLTTNSARRALEGIFDSPEIKRKFGQVDVNIESTDEAIEKILAVHRKTKLIVDISIPNPDEMEDMTEKLRRRLEKEHVRRQRVEKVSHHPEGLRPSEETLTLINLSKSNGKTTLTGYDAENEKVELSTEEHPLLARREYNPAEETPGDVLLRESDSIVRGIRGRPEKH